MLSLSLLTSCAGPEGPQGSAGPQGPTGASGDDGTDGTPGADGTDGAPGTDGTDGAPGTDGTDGAPGTDGTDGIDGAPGTPGAIDTTRFTGAYEHYDLLEVGASGVTGVVRIAELDDGSASLVTIVLDGQGHGIYPAHIHFNSSFEGGASAVALGNVDGLIGFRELEVTVDDAGDAISYDDLVGGDFYVNVHTSPTDGTVLAQADIGQNALTGRFISYPIDEQNTSGVSGTFTLYERVDGYTLAVAELDGTTAGVDHPTHVHASADNSVVISTAAVDGDTGIGGAPIMATDAGVPITWQELISAPYFWNVHTSVDDAAPLARGDIGWSELTGSDASYWLDEADSSGVSGWVRFYERKSGGVLVALRLGGTVDGDVLPAFVHDESVANGGPVLITLSQLQGKSGATATSYTPVDAFDDGGFLSFDDFLQMDVHVNVQASPTDSAVVTAGDVGDHAFTDRVIVYEVAESNTSGVSGDLYVFELKSGHAMVLSVLSGTTAGAWHPTHLHDGTTNSPVIDTPRVSGDTGLAIGTLIETRDGEAVAFRDIVGANAYYNVHTSPTVGDELARGNIGLLEVAGGASETFPLAVVAGSGVSGTVTVYERPSGVALIELALTGTVDGDLHPAHIHDGSVAAQGGIRATLESVAGVTGGTAYSYTAFVLDDLGDVLNYSDLAALDGYVNVHLSAADPSIIAQGDIGSNSN